MQYLYQKPFICIATARANKLGSVKKAVSLDLVPVLRLLSVSEYVMITCMYVIGKREPDRSGPELFLRGMP